MNNKTSLFGKEHDVSVMKQALRQAAKAFGQDEVPIGAVVVNAQGKIIGRGYNQVMKQKTQRAHAEALAIERAGKKQGDWRLEDCWLYVTLEPCSMCMSLVTLSRMAGVVYGANSPLFGFHLDNTISDRVYKKDALVLVPEVCEQESIYLLKTYFQLQRKKKDESRETRNRKNKTRVIKT